MIRVTEHTRREGAKPLDCCSCGTHIGPGDRYRSLVGMDTDIWDRGFVRHVAHVCCVIGHEGWELRDDKRRPTLDVGDPACAYVRERYGLMVERGSRVVANGRPGRVLGGTHHVWVHRDGERHPGPYHPDDVRLATGTDPGPAKGER